MGISARYGRQGRPPPGLRRADAVVQDGPHRGVT